MENELRLCEVCKKNETGRYWDGGGGFGEKKAVCGVCLVSGRWRELLPEATESTPEVTNDLLCSVCGKECKSAFGLKAHMRTHK